MWNWLVFFAWLLNLNPKQFAKGEVRDPKLHYMYILKFEENAQCINRVDKNKDSVIWINPFQNIKIGSIF